MQCATCENKPAQAICKFCGRAICKDCFHFKPYILAAYDENSDKPKVLLVEDALWCSKCHPVVKPITVPEIE